MIWLDRYPRAILVFLIVGRNNVVARIRHGKWPLFPRASTGLSPSLAEILLRVSQLSLCEIGRWITAATSRCWKEFEIPADSLSVQSN
jgi:hypothetical protein